MITNVSNHNNISNHNNSGNIDLVVLERIISQKQNRQRSKQIEETEALTREIYKTINAHHMDVLSKQAERTLENTKAKLIISKLSDKFSLISKIQQSMG